MLIQSHIQKIFTLCSMVLYILVHSQLLIADEIKPQATKIYVIEINQEILPSAQRTLANGIEEAIKLQSDFIILKLNTFGGLLDVADSMSALLLHCKIPTIVFITKNAASAGALISLSCDSIYMATSATIGAATVVNENQEPLPDKYQSYMRGLMRSAAETNGRNPLIAEGMVTPNNALSQIADSGKIITLTTLEALKYGYCNGEANDLNEIIKQLGISQFSITTYESTWVDELISWLTNPTVSSILLLIIIGGLYFEFQHPGIGVPLFACIIGAILYFVPLYIDGLAENWEILIFIAGLILMLLEIFVVPGFGLTGISGIILIVTGLTLSLVRNNDLDFSFTSGTDFLFALIRVSVVLLLAIVTGVFFGGSLFENKRIKKMVLTNSFENNNGHQTNDWLLGKTGIAQTDLRPSGKVLIDSDVFEATADGTYISRNESILVTLVKSNYLVVKKHKL